MSTASTTQQHHLTRPIALAAAATIAIIGGATAVGVALQNDSTAPSTPATHANSSHWPGCTDPRCLAPQQQQQNHPHKAHSQPYYLHRPYSVRPLPGGHIVDGQP
jgi:hypothetical protein